MVKRIVYFGSGEFGLPTLRALLERCHVALVVTQPDRPAGRNRAMTATPVGVFAAERGLDVIKPERCNAPDVIERVKAANADANVVIAYGQKVGDALVASPRLGRVATMNLHASLLPKYRGAAPINWAMIAGERVTGNTVFALVDRMDAGDILGVQETPIDPMETAGELHDRLSAMGPAVVLEVLDRLGAGAVVPRAQDESKATLAPKLSRADAVIDFERPALELRCRVHGLTPWPGVTVWYGSEREALRLTRVREVSRPRGGGGATAPGVMVGDGVIECGVGALELVEVQPPGGRAMRWQEYQRGRRVPTGTVFDGFGAGAQG